MAELVRSFRRRINWQLWAFILVAAAAIYSNIQLYQITKTNRDIISQAAADTRERRNQACTGSEATHKQEVIDLERSYRFYKDPPQEFRNLLANPLFKKSFLEAERAAIQDGDQYGEFVSKFCDDPGIGLPEPDPTIPERPDYIEKLFGKPLKLPKPFS